MNVLTVNNLYEYIEKPLSKVRENEKLLVVDKNGDIIPKEKKRCDKCLTIGENGYSYKEVKINGR